MVGRRGVAENGGEFRQRAPFSIWLKVILIHVGPPLQFLERQPLHVEPGIRDPLQIPPRCLYGLGTTPISLGSPS